MDWVTKSTATFQKDLGFLLRAKVWGESGHLPKSSLPWRPFCVKLPGTFMDFTTKMSFFRMTSSLTPTTSNGVQYLPRTARFESSKTNKVEYCRAKKFSKTRMYLKCNAGILISRFPILTGRIVGIRLMVRPLTFETFYVLSTSYTFRNIFGSWGNSTTCSCRELYLKIRKRIFLSRFIF